MSEQADKKFRPLFLVKPGTVNRKDIGRAERFCGICIVECAEPEAARYSEPPLGADLNEQARAALGLMRIIVGQESPNFTRGELTRWFTNQLLAYNQPPTIPPAKRQKP